MYMYVHILLFAPISMYLLMHVYAEICTQLCTCSLIFTHMHCTSARQIYTQPPAHGLSDPCSHSLAHPYPDRDMLTCSHTDRLTYTSPFILAQISPAAKLGCWLHRLTVRLISLKVKTHLNCGVPRGRRRIDPQSTCAIASGLKGLTSLAGL